MVKKWLHLNYDPRNPWGFKITAAINKAVEEGRCPAAPREIGELNLNISTRLDMISRALARINQDWKLLYEMIKNHGNQYVFTPGHEAYAFSVDEDVKHDLLLDINSFLFECNACCDLIINLIEIAHKHIKNPVIKNDIGRIIQRILKDNSQDTSWFVLLDKNRNLFIHNASPYVAVDISDEENNKYDLLIMNENIHEFEDSSKFVRLSELASIPKGFPLSTPVLENYIASLYAPASTEEEAADEKA